MSSSTSRTDEPTAMANMPPPASFTSNADQFEDAEYDVAFGLQQPQQAEQAPQSNGQFDDVDEDDDHFDFWTLQPAVQPRQQQIPANDAMAQRNDFNNSGGANGAAALPVTNGASEDDAIVNSVNSDNDKDDDTSNRATDDDPSNRGTDESSDNTGASSDDAMEAVEPVAAGVRTTRCGLRLRVLPPPGSQENPLVLEDSFSEASLESEEDVSMEDDNPNDENELPPELNPECWKYEDFPYHIPGGVAWPEGCYWYQPNSGWPVVKFHRRHKKFYCQKHVTAWWTKLPKDIRAQIAAGATKLKYKSFATMYIEPSKIMESKKRHK